MRLPTRGASHHDPACHLSFPLRSERFFHACCDHGSAHDLIDIAWPTLPRRRSLWLSNLLLDDAAPAPILGQVDQMIDVLRRRAYHVVIVSNEVGMGVVPPTPLGRAFRDVCGLAHQRLARVADELHVAVLGTILRIRPAPIELSPVEMTDVEPR